MTSDVPRARRATFVAPRTHGYGKPAVHARHDAGARLATRLDVLLDDLGDVLADHGDVVVGADEEPAEGVAVAEAAFLDLDGGHHQEGSIAVAGEDVADARPAGAQQTLAVRDALLDLGGVLGVVGHQQPAGLLLPPAEVGDAVVVAVQDARLAGRGGGRQQRIPVAQLVRPAADPAGHHRHSPGAQGVRQHVVGQAVELDDDETGRVGAIDVRSATGKRAHQGAVVGVVLGQSEAQADGARRGSRRRRR